MMGASETLCFTCGQPAGGFPRLNHLPSGQVCPTCRNRLLEALPPLLPGGLEGADELEEVEDATPRAPHGLSPAEGIWGPFLPDSPA